MMFNNKKQKVDELYQKYGGIVLRSLKQKFGIEPEDAEDVLQNTFCKLFSNIQFIIGSTIFVRSRKGIEPIFNEKAWIFKIARNLAITFLASSKPIVTNWNKIEGDKEEENDPFDSFESLEPEPSIILEEHDEKRCMSKCYRETLEKLFPHAVYPLIIALCELEAPIEKIADVISQSIPDTEKLLKKSYQEMRTLKKVHGKKCVRHAYNKRILDRCRDEKANYKDYYNDYQAKHSRQEGTGSLCWLLAELHVSNMTMAEIGLLINKDLKTTQKAWDRCFDLINEEAEKCIRQHCGG